jgi:hypothetical protein
MLDRSAGPGSMTGDSHLVPLPGTGWQVWRHALLRTAGFPAGELDRLAAPACARAADDHLDGRLPAGTFRRAFEEAACEVSRQAHEIAGDPRFREAVAWQSPGAVQALDGLLRDGPEPRGTRKRERYRRRHREDLVARYWQRYCAKAETTGWWGPVCWVALDPAGPAVVARPGPRLVRERRVYFEHWALEALLARLAADAPTRRWLPAAMQPHLRLDGRRVIRPAQPAAPLSAPEAALLARCDGCRPVIEVARELIGEGWLREAADIDLLLDSLVDRGLAWWPARLPLDLGAEGRLRGWLAAIGERDLRDRALAALDLLGRARDAAAAADGGTASARLARLDAEFVAITGRDARHRPGATYAGRTVCHLETSRDLDLVFGKPVLEAVARPLELLLVAARWLTAALAEAYTAALRELYDDLASSLGRPEIPLGQLWYLAQGPLFGAGERPADRIVAEFVRRWASLLGLDRLPPGCRGLELAAADLGAEAVRIFDADRPGWSGARLHSPDLHLCATGPDAVARGDFTAVVGEMHAAWATLDLAFAVAFHPAPDELRGALDRDLGPGRPRLLLPADWPRFTARLARAGSPSDRHLAFQPAAGADRDRVLPLAALTVSEENGRLVAGTAGGVRWPLVEVFADLLATHAVDAFKSIPQRPHTPRVTVDRLVIVRETWRTTIGATGLAGRADRSDLFLRARRWRRQLRAPERVFAGIAGELKPVYVDFTSPAYVSSFCAMLRSARLQGGDGVELRVTEMLPSPEQAWVPDAEGGRYLSELRLQVRDPEVAR